jgi:hypothetical protein
MGGISGGGGTPAVMSGVGGGTPPAVMGGSLGGGGGTPAVEAFSGQTGGGGGAGLCSGDAQQRSVSMLAPNIGIVSSGLPAQVLPTFIAAISMQYRSHADVCEATEN